MNLSEAFDHPDRVADLPLTGMVVLLAQAATVTARVTAAMAIKQDAPATTPKTADLITVQEAMKITKLRARWFYEKAGDRHFGFIKRLSAHTIRVDKSALLKWIAAR